MVSQVPPSKAASQLAGTSKASQLPKASPTKAKKRLKYKVLINKIKNTIQFYETFATNYNKSVDIRFSAHNMFLA